MRIIPCLIPLLLATPILADILGLAPTTTVRWAALAARDWSQYTALRRQDTAEFAGSADQ